MIFIVPNSLGIFYGSNTILRTCPKYFHDFPTPSARSGNHLLKQHFFLGGCFLTGELSGRTTDTGQKISPKRVGSFICKPLYLEHLLPVTVLVFLLCGNRSAKG